MAQASSSDSTRDWGERDALDRGPQAHYFARLAQGHFEIQRCEGCGRYQFYPRAVCMHCGATDLQWVAPSGEGTVYAFSIVRRKPQAGGDYNVALIDLHEGVRMMGRIDEVPLTELHIGMPVRVRVVQGEEGPLVVFVPGARS